jgi:dUTP pyrophosphatase
MIPVTLVEKGDPVLKIRKLVPEAVIPRFATDGAAGMDLTATRVSLEADERGTKKFTYETGLAFEIPRGYVGLIFPRSSIHKVDLALTNCVGVIDSDYRGEVKFVFKVLGDAVPYMYYAAGDRIGQLVLMKLPSFQVQEVDELSSTERGEGGFGSTGR